MRMTRGCGWGMDLFLWVCPLVGVCVFVGAVLMGQHPRPPDDPYQLWTFDVPGRIVTAVALASFGVPLIVSLLTRRLLGFLAGACLLLGVAAGTGWVDSHRVTRHVELIRLTGPPDHSALRQIEVTSQGGGVVLVCFNYERKHIVASFGNRYLSPGREESLSLEQDGAQQRYPSQIYPFQSASLMSHRMGFAMATHPEWLEWIGPTDIPFALALPYWFLCLLAIPFPLAWTIRLRRRRRIARRAASGLCMACGYDLRATPDSTGALLPICPECGAPARAAHPPATTPG